MNVSTGAQVPQPNVGLEDLLRGCLERLMNAEQRLAGIHHQLSGETVPMPATEVSKQPTPAGIRNVALECSMTLTRVSNTIDSISMLL